MSAAHEQAAERPQAQDGPVRHHRHGTVATITMNRPEYRNPQNSATAYPLDRAIHRAAEDDETKAVVLAGAERHFSAGRSEVAVRAAAQALAADPLGGTDMRAMKEGPA
ncbi:enoyl-CoA hydratase-related protein [Streptomyces sp. NPDC006012]|uniref:enoyl-CoA hydratase-related protein n=1 Tax=Streptomyces sp. NPDC006012 TaxID=3364739 RepID=UPI00367872B9